MIKPNPPIYQILLERIGRKPQDCVFIDDVHLTNIQAAQRLGFQVIQFFSPTELRDELSKLSILQRSSPDLKPKLTVLFLIRLGTILGSCYLRP